MTPEEKIRDTSRTGKGLTYETISGLLWMFSGKGVRAVLRIVVLIILARLLSPHEFGLLGAALVVFGFATLLSQLGMQPALVQRPILEERHLRTAFTASILFALLLAAVIAVCAPWIAAFFKTEELIPILRFMALVSPIYGLTVVAGALLQREMRFRVIAVVEMLSYLVGFGVVGITFAIMGFGVWSLVAAHTVASLISAVLSLAVQPHPKRPQLDRRAFAELMTFGGGFTIAKVFNTLARQGDNLVIGRWLGPAALGMYGRAYQLLVFPVNLFGTVLAKVLFPSMARIQDDLPRLQAAYRRCVSLIALLFAPISLAAFVLAPELVQVILGPQWTDVTGPFQILALGMMFRAGSKIADSVARATGAVYRRAWRQGVYAAVIIGGAWVGQHWGITGVSVGVLIALTANYLLMAQLSLSLTKIRWKDFLDAHIPALLLAALTFGEVWLIASTLRGLEAPAVIVLLISVGLVATIHTALVFAAPRLMLGADGKWMLDTLIDFFAMKLSRSGKGIEVNAE